MPETFAAQVDAWVRKTDTTTVDVFREATRDLAREVMLPKDEGGHMPVITGNLRNSLAASTTARPPVRWAKRGKGARNDFPPNEGQLEAVIAGATIGQTLFLGFQAPYAQKAELHDGNGFVRLTAQRWSQIVEQAVRTVRGWAGT